MVIINNLNMLRWFLKSLRNTEKNHNTVKVIKLKKVLRRMFWEIKNYY